MTQPIQERASADPAGERTGLIAACAAYAWWGVLPIYLRLVDFADPMEVLAQRILWCIPAAFATLIAMGGLSTGIGELRAALAPRRFGLLLLSAVFIFFNWGLYVWAVAQRHLVEASLAYFLTPLVQVAFGVAFFRERLNLAQSIALGFALVGVAVQGLAMGALPVISIALCLSWSLYTLVRKQAPVSSGSGLLIESAVLAPAAIALLFWTSHGPGLAFPKSMGNAAMLMLAGPFTAVPLILFAYGARRLSFVTLGPLQYATPTFQFLLAILYGEAVTPLRVVSFAFIWIGLGVFTWDVVARERRRRRMLRAA
jgi:chloramphenicol-sensitive protein RarD